MTAIEEIKAALAYLRLSPCYRSKADAALSRLAELEKAEPEQERRDRLSAACAEVFGWPAAAPQVPAMRMLTAEEIATVRDATFGETISGRFIDRKIAAGIQRKFCEVNGLAAPKEPTPNSGADGAKGGSDG